MKRGVIKGLLAEELENSLRMKKEYERLLRGLPQGALVVKRIGAQSYCYLAKRIGGKVKHSYMGKLSIAEQKKYRQAMRLRAKYRKLLSQTKKQITFLRGTIRGKEPI